MIHGATCCREDARGGGGAIVRSIDDLHYGYTGQAWQQMVEVGHQFLADVARRGRLTTYTEFCQVIRQRTGTDMDTGVYALRSLLNDISLAAFTESKGALLTSLVTYLDDNRPGEGFFLLAQEQELLPKGQVSPQKKEAFWAQQVALIHAAYGH